jgi:hypothetical protein
MPHKMYGGGIPSRPRLNLCHPDLGGGRLSRWSQWVAFSMLLDHKRAEVLWWNPRRGTSRSTGFTVCLDIVRNERVERQDVGLC